MATPIKIINHAGFITDLKVAHKGVGIRLRLMPRNKNRKQFYPETNRTVTYRDGSTRLRKSRFQQDLPTRFASHFAFYGDKNILTALAAIYKKGGINVFHTV